MGSTCSNPHQTSVFEAESTPKPDYLKPVSLGTISPEPAAIKLVSQGESTSLEQTLVEPVSQEPKRPTSGPTLAKTTFPESTKDDPAAIKSSSQVPCSFEPAYAEPASLEPTSPATASNCIAKMMNSSAIKLNSVDNETDNLSNEQGNTEYEIVEDQNGDNVSEVGDQEGEIEVEKKKKVPMTQAELEDFKSNKFADLRNTASEVFSMESYQNEDGEFDKIVRNACVRYFNSYLALKRTDLKEIVKYRLQCAKILIDTKFVDICTEIIAYTYAHGWHTNEGKKHELKYAPMSKSFVILLNYTDCSDELAVYLANKESFLELLKTILLDYQDRQLGTCEPALKHSEETVLNCALSIIHNLSMRETNIGRLRNLDFTNVLQPYLKSAKALNRLNVLASLAGIINEEECDIINANKETVMFLLKVLRNGLADKRRRDRGWSCRESALAVRALARNDANKKLLVELGVLELLVELGTTGNSDEQYESVSAIWALSFEEDNRSVITGKAELGVVDLLVNLKDVGDINVQKACNGALWTLRDALKTSVIEKYKQIGEVLAQKHDKHKDELARNESFGKSSTDTGGHIMISYQWADQQVLKTIRDRLKANGYKVWMDIDQMGGSTLQAMADAVEGAKVFLMSMTNKYKNSPACRAEAEYAFQIQKKIIPLKLEKGYGADGWLGFILGAKLFFDFSGKYPFEDKMQGLLKEVECVIGRNGGNRGIHHQTASLVSSEGGPHALDHPDTATADHTVAKVPVPVAMTTLANVRKWSTAEVTEWIERNDLKICNMDQMTGSEIAFLAKMQMEAPEFFHKFLQHTLKANDVYTMSKIVWALHDLLVS